MVEARNFAPKLSLMLKALSLSRARLAADIGVDKSLVTRWCAGAFAPSAHNLSRISQAIAVRRPGFTISDWERNLEALATRYGGVVPEVTASHKTPSGIAEWLAMPKLREVAMNCGPTSAALGGFWRAIRPYPEALGSYLRDPMYLRPTPDGPSIIKVGVLSSRMSGWAMPVGDQLFFCVTDEFYGYSTFGVFNHVYRGQVDLMDGLLCACLRGDGGVPTSCACLMERIEDLTGDAAADEARYQELLAENPLASENSVSEAMRRRLSSALSTNGDPFLRVPSVTSLARTPSLRKTRAQLRNTATE